MKFEAAKVWEGSLFLKSEIFSDLVCLFNINKYDTWINAKSLVKFLPLNAKNENGKQISFIAQDESFTDERYYERYIFDTGVIPTRVDNWHDLFGAFIWCLFPKTKALINKLHVEDIETFGMQARTERRNAITLLDECGVVCAVSNQTLKENLVEHKWTEAFLNNHDAWNAQITPFMFGHANYEMATNPYIGLTGKVLFIDVDEDFHALDKLEQYQFLDSTLVQMIKEKDILKDNKIFSPLPLLGVPKWHQEVQDEAFYSNTRYFRPKSTKKKLKRD